MIQSLETRDEQQSLLSCGCGSDECAASLSSSRNNHTFTWGQTFEYLKTNSRFRFLVMSFFIATFGVIINWIFEDPSWINYLWWSSALVGLVIPAKLAFKSLQKKILTINTLLTIATLSALLLGLYEEAVILVIVFSLGEVLESVLVKTMEGGIESLKTLVPSTARIVTENNQIEEVPVALVSVGQTLLLRTGDIIPIDSKILDSPIEIQKSHLTGESSIVNSLPGEIIYAGSVVVRGSAMVESIVDAGESQVHHIVKSVEESLKRKSGAERFSEKFGKYYTPTVFILAAFIALIVPYFSTLSPRVWLIRALVVLVVSCACGLALSVPVTMISAVASAAKHSVLIRGGASIEKIGRIRAIVFDKTGTLTTGLPQVKEIKIFDEVEERNLLTYMQLLVSRSNHPISKGIAQYLSTSSNGINHDIQHFEEIAGLGIKGIIEGNEMAIERDLDLKYSEQITNEFDSYSSYSVVRYNGKNVGLIIFADSIRKEAKQTIQKLKEKGIHVVMLTGDDEHVAKSVANELQIENYEARILPSEKVNTLHRLKHKFGYVAMVGDGINDAPALAEADVSFAMGHSGTEIASDVSDIVLMEDNLTKIPQTIEHGIRAYRIARWNIILALFTVFGLLVLAGLGVLNLVSGIIANEATALLIITNGLRLMHFKED
ncbi:MAG: heavy metal translocating P-type ATPase [Candidatus Kariarchaeaceae archaeon]|jgi:Cd2+/Zn2+-exporting ATPase